MNTQLAKFKCKSCQQEWQSKPGPTQCPFCGGLYIDWVNYAEMYVNNRQGTKK